MSTDILLATLQLAVPMRIHELAHMTEHQRWGFRDAWRGQAVDAIACKGDVLQYGGRKGEAAEVFNHLARGLAALAYAPGGVLFAGLHWCAEHPGGRWASSIIELTCQAGDLTMPADQVTDAVVVGGVL